MRHLKFYLTMVLLSLTTWLWAQQIPEKGTPEYYESLRFAFQTKIDWVANNPEEHAMATESGWYEMANANVQTMIEYKQKAQNSPTGKYFPPKVNNPQTAYSMSEPQPGGGTCAEAAPFCSGEDYDFPCQTNTQSESGPNYNCLSTRPNPAWYFMQIDDSGDIELLLTANSDVDFIIWGPFDQVTCDPALLSANNVEDCSYSASATETPEIQNAIHGQWYMMLITNYSNQPQNFHVTQSNYEQPGAGTLNCGILCPIQPDDIDIELGECEPHAPDALHPQFWSTYDVTATLEFEAHEDIDSLVFYYDDQRKVAFDTTGTQFVESGELVSPIVTNIPDLLCDGAAHNVKVLIYYEGQVDTVGVVDTHSCEANKAFNAPNNCANCVANAGQDREVCGTQLQMQGSSNDGDYNIHWTKLNNTPLDIDDNASPTTIIDFTGSFIAGNPVEVPMVITITNYQNLTCSDTAMIKFKPKPSANFTMPSSACGAEHFDVFHNPETNGANVVAYDWSFEGEPEETTGTLDAQLQLKYENTIGNKQICLTTTSDIGCASDPICHIINIKQVPSSKFTIGGNICHQGETIVTYANENNPPINCPSITYWDFGDAQATPITDPECSYSVTATNYADEPTTIKAYPIKLQVSYNGCVSPEPYVDTLYVVKETMEHCCFPPEADAGGNATICGLDYALQAHLGGGGNHGQWVQVSGPSVTFPNNDKGSAIEPGNPNALIHASEAGVVVMKWIEHNGECQDDDQVEITFIKQPQIDFPNNPVYACGNIAHPEVVSNVSPGTSFKWLDESSDLEFDDIYSFNPGVTSTAFSSYKVRVVGTVGGLCRDTNEVTIVFNEAISAYAGLDNSTCGVLDTLGAFLTFGQEGHWEVASAPSGTNCSASFNNHETGLPDIYDPKAVVTVSCFGEWTFKWIVEAGACTGEDEVKITFTQPSTNINASFSQPVTCLDTVRLNVDTTGYSLSSFHWEIKPQWAAAHPQVKLIFNAYEPNVLLKRDFSNEQFGEEGKITIPMEVTLMTQESCASKNSTSVTFYQRPQPYLGRDTAVCASEKAFNVLPTIPTDISEAVWIQDSQTQYNVTNETGYNTVVSANPGDSIPIIFSEENTLGNDHPSCLVKDTIWIDFLKRPIADAGDDEYHVCGNAIQLEARLDESLNSIGRWLIHTGGFFGYSEGDNDPTAVKDTNAWFYHSTAINPGVDTLYLKWREFNAKSAQCFSEDQVPVYFWYKDTAYIKLNGTSSLVDSTCGQVYTGISGNDNMPTNQWSKGTWKTEDGSSVEWFKDGQNGQYNSPQLDSIKIGTIGEQNANIWREIYWEIGNGYINGDQPPVCYDRSEAVKIRFDNLVYANIVESANYPKPLYNCGDTLVLSAGDKKPWSHFQWLPNNYTYMNLAGTPNTDQADTLDNPVIVAPSNIYPNTDTSLTGDNAYRQLHLKVSNGMCVAYDTINVTFAPIPTGEFTVNKPACANQAARLTVKKDNLTGFNVHLTDIEWFFEDGDEPTSVVYTNPDVKDTADIIWGNSAENNDYKHAVSLKVTNYWGCSFQKFPPDTVFEPLPSYVELQKAKPTTCGECNGYVSVINKSNISKYTIEWAGDEAFENIIKNNELDTLASDTLNEVCDGRYFLRISYQSATGLNCQDTMSFNILPNPSTIAMSEFAFNADTSDLQAPVALGELLSNTSSNANKYQWQVFSGTTDDLSLLLNESTANVPDFSLVNAGEYHIKLQALNDKAPNCAVLPYSVTIYVEYESTLAVPNVFTPNGDGINEEFKVKAQSITDYKCIIYNRWGTKMFETTDPSESWNGKVDNNGSEANPGPYFYVITAKSKKTGDEIKKEGALQLVR